MVVRKRWRLGLAAVLPGLVLGLLAGPAGPAAAAGGGRAGACGSPANPCVIVTTPGSPGGSTGGGGGGNGGGGTELNENGCPNTPGTTFPGAVLYTPPPPKSDPIWQGHTDGAIYSGAGWCKDGQAYLGPWVRWFAVAPAAPVVDPAVLARQALAALRMPAPVMHRSPTEANRDAGGPYTWVNLWTWYWTTPAVWQTRSRTAALGGVWATVTVKPVRMEFTPGDGSAASTCTGPGRAWTAADGNAAPAGGGCGVRYTRVSKGVTSTLSMHWAATWTSSTGAGGTLPVADTQTSSTFSVQQIQVVSR